MSKQPKKKQIVNKKATKEIVNSIVEAIAKKETKKMLVAVVTCHKFRDKANAQRKTCFANVPENVDVVFFLGKGKQEPLKDEVHLDVDDGYAALPLKVKAICKYALENGYEYLCKMDDDTYIRLERLMASGFEGKDYVGRLRGPSGFFPYCYNSGFTYILSRKAMKILVDNEPVDTAEDRSVGNVLGAAGIAATPDYRFVVIKSTRNAKSGTEGPRKGNNIISCGELDPAEMIQIDQDFFFKESKLKVGSRPGEFQDIAVLIKTFLRDGHLIKTVEEVEAYLPGAQMIIVDDGYESKEKIELYANLRLRGHKTIWLPFDSGFCAKSNAGVDVLDRPYMLIASDDFVFDKQAAIGVEKMLDVLRSDVHQAIGMASGTVDNRQYQGFITKENGVVTETLLEKNPKWKETPNGTKCIKVDITVNYGLVRREVFFEEEIVFDQTEIKENKVLVDLILNKVAKVEKPSKIRWADYKIGGDHFEFFAMLKDCDWDVAFVKDVNINQRRYQSKLQHPTYAHYRSRAKDALPAFFKKCGITKYIAFDGRADVLQEDGTVISVAPPRPLINPFGAEVVPVKFKSKNFVSKERLYVNEHDQIVPINGVGRRKRLLVAKGGKIPLETALRYNLIEG